MDPKHLMTPGANLTEPEDSRQPIVGVPTAVPGFVGYTETAEVDGKSVHGKPVKITSLAVYEEIFGKGFSACFRIDKGTADDFDIELTKVDESKEYRRLSAGPRFYLYESLCLFFDNGGGDAYVVSVGTYTDGGAQAGGVSVSLDALQSGLKALGAEPGPTLLAIPDAMLLPNANDVQTLVSHENDGMLAQCGRLRDRMAILDVYGTDTLDGASPDVSAQLDALMETLYDTVGNSYLSYGAVYFPFLETNLVSESEIDYTRVAPGGSAGDLASLLQTQADVLYAADEARHGEVQQLIDAMATTTEPEAIAQLDKKLAATLPILGEIKKTIASRLSTLPPSAALAGVMTQVDQMRGVWNAPANQSLVSVKEPTVQLDDAQQGKLNAPAGGKSVNAIRSFPGRGTVVWGARTLDGNTEDWRYIQVRRTLIYVEQSVQQGLEAFVFSPNEAGTWAEVVSTVSSFLQNLWSQGGLMGASASEAFHVQCGLGTTMTAQDLLDGFMTVQIQLSLVSPAEFITITLRQELESSS